MLGYVLAMGLVMVIGGDNGLTHAASWGLTFAVAAMVAAQIAALLVFIRDSDEFVRALTARRFILAAGGAMALVSAWGFAEQLAGVPHMPGWAVYPLFWGLFAVVTPFVRSSN